MFLGLFIPFILMPEGAFWFMEIGVGSGEIRYPLEALLIVGKGPQVPKKLAEEDHGGLEV